MKSKQVNNLTKVLLLILIFVSLIAIFISEHYLSTNMAYYRMMHIVNERFASKFNVMMIIYIILILILSVVKINKFSILNVIYSFIIITSYYKFDYLNKNVVVIAMMLFMLFSSILIKLVESKRQKIILYVFMFITIVYVCIIKALI